MWTLCTNCKQEGVRYDTSQRCDVCCMCGVAADTALVHVVETGPDHADNFYNEKTVTKFRIGKSGDRGGLTVGINHGHTKIGLLGKEQLERLMIVYGVSPAVQEQALQLYRSNCKKRSQSREARALAGACLMVILRKEKRVVSFKEIADACDTTVKSVGRQFKSIQQQLLAVGDPSAPLQPTMSESVRFSLDMYANKMPKGEFGINVVVKKALSLAEWIDVCTAVHKWPPHLFALSVFYLSFKAVNVTRFFHLEFMEFIRNYDLCPESNLVGASFQKISPKALIQEIVSVVNQKAPSMALTPSSFFFLVDMIIELKPLLQYKPPSTIPTNELDSAYVQFQQIKQEQEMRELQPAKPETENLASIPDSEVDEYILTDHEVEERRKMLREAGVQ